MSNRGSFIRIDADADLTSVLEQFDAPPMSKMARRIGPNDPGETAMRAESPAGIAFKGFEFPVRNVFRFDEPFCLSHGFFN